MNSIDNVYLRESISNIIYSKKVGKKYLIELDNSIFYPGGGGQPCDLGKIDNIDIEDINIENNRIFITLNTLPSKNEVKCILDWERRYDFMQQHLGQHILSSVLYNNFSINTIGFRLGVDSLYIDIDNVLIKDQIDDIELQANNIVFNNLSVKCYYKSKYDLNKLRLRTLPPLKEDIRIVEIENHDRVPCCGTHPYKTGDVGLIKITNYLKYKNGLRINFLCGKRAYVDCKKNHNIITDLNKKLSIKRDELIEMIVSMKSNEQVLKKDIDKLENEMIVRLSNDLLSEADIHGNIRIIINRFKDEDYKKIKKISTIINSKKKNIVIFCNFYNEKVQILLSCSKDIDGINMFEILSNEIGIIGGKCGGTQYYAEGGSKNLSHIDKFISNCANNLINKLERK